MPAVMPWCCCVACKGGVYPPNIIVNLAGFPNFGDCPGIIPGTDTCGNANGDWLVPLVTECSRDSNFPNAHALYYQSFAQDNVTAGGYQAGPSIAVVIEWDRCNRTRKITVVVDGARGINVPYATGTYYHDEFTYTESSVDEQFDCSALYALGIPLTSTRGGSGWENGVCAVSAG